MAIISCCLLPDFFVSLVLSILRKFGKCNYHHILYLHCFPETDIRVDSSRLALVKLLMWNYALRSADQVVCVSKALCDTVITSYNPNCTHIYNYVSQEEASDTIDSSYLDRFELSCHFSSKRWIDFHRNANRTVLCTHCFLKPGKNLSSFIPIIAQNSSIAWLIVGDGPEYQNLLTLANSLLDPSRILITGFVPNPFPLIKYCDAYISFSLSEGFGLSSCEAYLMGLPIIVPDNPTNLEIFAGLSGAYLYSPGFLSLLLSQQKSLRKPLARDIAAFSDLFSIESFCRTWQNHLINSTVF